MDKYIFKRWMCCLRVCDYLFFILLVLLVFKVCIWVVSVFCLDLVNDLKKVFCNWVNLFCWVELYFKIIIVFIKFFRWLLILSVVLKVILFICLDFVLFDLFREDMEIFFWGWGVDFLGIILFLFELGLCKSFIMLVCFFNNFLCYRIV